MRGRWATLLFLLLPMCAGAAELYGPSAGVVPFGMGRAYTAVADDWLALHYNPAGLALVNGAEIQAFDLKMAANEDVYESYDNVKTFSENNNNLANSLNRFIGKHIQANIDNITQITMPHFALAARYDVNIEVDLQNMAMPKTMARYSRDFTIMTGLAGALGKKKDLRFGMRLGRMVRKGGVKYLSTSEIIGNRASLVDQFQDEDAGWGLGLGAQYKLPTGGRTEVVLGWAWHDVGKTSFGSYSDTRRPTRIEDVMNAGIAVRFPIGGRANRRVERRYGPQRSSNHLTLAADYSHINQSLDKEHLPKHLHLGMNLDLPLLALQAGWNQTSLTYGFSFDLGVVRVNAASYAEEIGSYGGQRKDRRYMLSLGSTFGFKGGRR